MDYIVKLYSSMGLVLAEYHVISGSRKMAVESAIIQYTSDYRRMSYNVDSWSVRICEECDIPTRIK